MIPRRLLTSGMELSPRFDCFLGLQSLIPIIIWIRLFGFSFLPRQIQSRTFDLLKFCCCDMIYV